MGGGFTGGWRWWCTSEGIWSPPVIKIPPLVKAARQPCSKQQENLTLSSHCTPVCFKAFEGRWHQGLPHTISTICNVIPVPAAIREVPEIDSKSLGQVKSTGSNKNPGDCGSSCGERWVTILQKASKFCSMKTLGRVGNLSLQLNWKLLKSFKAGPGAWSNQLP